MTDFRVVCPDGLVTETFDGRTAERYARDHAERCDTEHDGAYCVGPHRVERATWTEVEPPRCDHYTTHVEGCPGCRTRADEIHAHYARTAKTGSGD